MYFSVACMIFSTARYGKLHFTRIEPQKLRDQKMNSNSGSTAGETRSIYASGVVEDAIRKGRRLRAEAIRNAFAHLRPTLGPVD